MSDVTWTTLVQVQRSYLDPRVWIPYDYDDAASTLCMYAGPVRAVKRYVEDETRRNHGEDMVLRWRRDGDETWMLELREAAP